MKRNLEKGLCVFLSLMTLVGCLAGCTPAAESDTHSLVSSAPSAPPVNDAPMVEEDFITRAEWVEQLVKAAAGEEYNPVKAAELEPYFGDVDETIERYGYIQTAAMMEWLDADVAKGLFEPDAPATRAFVAYTAVLAAGYMMVDGEDEPTDEIMQSADPVALLFAKRLGVIAEDESGSLRAEETVDEALCEEVLGWYASVNTWEEDLPDVTEFNPGVNNLFETELAYTLDAENILRLPEDFGEAPVAGDILLLPATEELPDGMAVKVTGGDAATGYTTETPALEEIFSSLSLTLGQELDLEGEARLTDNGSTSASAGEGQPLPPPEGTAEDGVEVRRDDLGRLWEDLHWDYEKTYPITDGLTLDVNKIDLQVSIRYGEPFRNAVVPVPDRLKEMKFALEMRSLLTFDFALSIKLADASISKTFEKDFLKVGNWFANVYANLSLTAEASGEGSVGIPLGGKAQFNLGEQTASTSSPVQLEKPNVRLEGELEASLSLQFDVGVKLFGITVVSNALMSSFTATAEYQNDDYGTCMGIDANVSVQYVMDLGSDLIAGGIDTLLNGIEQVLRFFDSAQIYDPWESKAFKELKRFRDCLVNSFRVPVPEEPLTVPVGNLHWEGESVASLRRNPNDVCTRNFELELAGPASVKVDESASLSVAARPTGSGRVGLSGRVKASSQSPSILSCHGTTVAGRSEGTATVELVWVFSDEAGEWDSLLKGNGSIEVTEEDDSSLPPEEPSSSDGGGGGSGGGGGGANHTNHGGPPYLAPGHCPFCNGDYTDKYYPDGCVDKPSSSHGPQCLDDYDRGISSTAGRFRESNGDGITPYDLRWGENAMVFFSEQANGAGNRYAVRLYCDNLQVEINRGVDAGVGEVDLSAYMVVPGEYIFTVHRYDDGILSVSEPLTVTAEMAAANAERAAAAEEAAWDAWGI